MKVKELIAALQKCDPDKEVDIVIKQYNERYGKIVRTHPSTQEKIGYELWVDNSSFAARITVSLPGKAIVSRWPL